MSIVTRSACSPFNQGCSQSCGRVQCSYGLPRPVKAWVARESPRGGSSRIYAPAQQRHVCSRMRARWVLKSYSEHLNRLHGAAVAASYGARWQRLFAFESGPNGGRGMRTKTIRVILAMEEIGTPELARRAGVNRVTAWRWVAGHPDVSRETAERLTRALLGPAGIGDDPRIDGVQAVPAGK